MPIFHRISYDTSLTFNIICLYKITKEKRKPFPFKLAQLEGFGGEGVEVKWVLQCGWSSIET